MNSIYIYIYAPTIFMNWLDMEIFAYNMHELARYIDIRLRYG